MSRFPSRFPSEIRSKSKRRGLGFLYHRSPALIFNLKQPTQAKHEARDAVDDVLIDRHCNQHEHLKLPRLSLAYLCPPVTFANHEFGEVVCLLSFACFKREVDFAWFIEIIPRLIVFYEEISVCFRRLCEQLEHCHGVRILNS